MKSTNFNKLKREKTPKQIIYLHCHNKIFLTGKQINELIKLKNEKYF